MTTNDTFPLHAGESLYRTNLNNAGSASYPALEGIVSTETCIIGGGFAGLGTAISLMERGQRDVVIVEAERIAHGASGRNGGFVFGGFSLDAADLVRQLNRKSAQDLYGMTLQAVDKIRNRIKQYQIACSHADNGVILANWFRNPAPLRSLSDFMQEKLGVTWEWMSREETRNLLCTERYHAALFERNAFHFDPLAYAAGLAQQLTKNSIRIYEHSRVLKIQRSSNEWRLNFPNGSTISCNNLVICCGGYIDGLLPELARASLPIATYVVATEPLGSGLQEVMKTGAAVYDTRFAFDYYRPLPDSRLLWGGRISAMDRSPADVANILKKDMLKVYPQLRDVAVTHAWSGMMGYARHKMPQIGKLDSGIYYAQAFGGHGVAPTTMAGEILAGAIIGDAEIPAEFSRFGLPPTFGVAGKMGAQLTYWWLETKDAIRALI